MGEDIQVKREITLEADAETLERMRKEGHAGGLPFIATRRNAREEITPRRRLPIRTLAGFLTARPNFPVRGNEKTKIDKAKVFVKARFKSEGSVLRETIEAMGLGFETRCELESSEPPAKVAAVVRKCGERMLRHANDSQANSGGASVYAQRCCFRSGGIFYPEIKGRPAMANQMESFVV